MNTLPLQGWLPIKIDFPETGPQVDWCHFGQARLLEPFFEESLSRRISLPFNKLFRHKTSPDTLSDWQKASPGIPPTGFIFHLSRCGSTLVCQMLAALEKTVVVSEAPAVDDVLRVAKLRGISEEQRIAWLQGMMSALGQQRAGGESQFFVKFDNWHALDLPLIRKAFPEVPWIFLFRDPVEILVSQVSTPAPHSFPSMMKFGLPEMDAMKAGLTVREEYCAQMLAHYSKAVLAELATPHSKGIAVNYEELPQAMFTRIADHFQLSFTPEEREKMQATTLRHSKTRHEVFQNDSEKKQQMASDTVKAASAKWLGALFETLRVTAAQG